MTNTTAPAPEQPVGADSERAQLGAEKVAFEFASQRALLLPVYLPTFCFNSARGSVLVALPLEVLAQGYSYDVVGTLTGIMGCGIVFGNVPCGMFVSAWGPRSGLILSALTLVMAACLAILATFVKGTIVSLIALILSFFLVGLADTAAVVSRVTILSAAVPSSFRGRVGSSLGGILRFGMTVGPFIAGYAAEFFDSRAVFYVMIAFAGVSALLTVAFMPRISARQQIVCEKSKAGTVSVESPESKPSMIRVIKNHWRVLFTVAFFSACLTFVRKGRELLFPLIGHSQGIAPDRLGQITSLSFAIDGILFPLAGKMLDHVGRKPTGAASLLGLGVATLLLILGSIGNFAFIAFLAFAVVGGVSNGISSGVVQVLAADLAPSSARSEFIAVFRMLTRSADIVAPALIGILAESSTLMVSEIVVACVSVLGTIWVVFFVQETRPRKKNMSMDVPAPEAIGNASKV
eukprot:TRINITY_DN16414_c0_g1_i1.p1 TRINITY_DN16414_c0_g1~~TRINITY_DN16414_c0_g1_i1.p1  ORF type:complete len:463 (+),score=38.03 TRINITY_DN16414_c0_g1_i1:64-1452(+)